MLTPEAFKTCLVLTEHEGEFYVHHTKLVEYGVMSSTRSSHVKERLDALGLVEDEEYSLLRDVSEQWKGARGTKHDKVYMLTPEAS
jgi:phosphosulfolactate phosphohydrolase-like enzyme